MSLLPTNSASAATNYSDIPVKHRAYEEINYLAQSNITTSDNPSRFSPDGHMTRAHAAAMIGNAIQLLGDQKDTQFSDVPSSNFASGYIEESVKRGIIKGYGDGTFKPDQTLTRGEMAQMISRAFGYQSANVSVAARELMDKGISKGTGNGYFGTGDKMKRGDFTIFLARAINADFRVGEQAISSTAMYVDVNETESLNMRQGPSTNYQVSKKLFTAYPVEVLYKVGDWVFVKVDKDSGFLHSNFLSTNQPSVSSIKDPIDLEVEPPITDTNNALSNLVVIVDPGHGGSDPGSAGNGLIEKDVVLDISKRAKRYFQKTPMQVKMTRETDVFIPLSGRVRFANAHKGDLFISIHANAFNGSASGIETYYYGAGNNPYVAQSKALATYTQKRMLEAWKLADRKVKHKSLHVIRENSMPATLVEIGFIDNKKDSAYIGSASHRDAMAKAIFLGTLDYLYYYEGHKEVASLYSQFNAKPSGKRH